MLLDSDPVQRIQYASRFLVLLGVFILSSFLVFPLVAVALASSVFDLAFVDISAVLSNPAENEKGVAAYLLIQAISSIGGFLITAVVFLKVYGYNPLDYLNLNKKPALPALGLCLLLIFSNLAVVALLGAFNYSIPVPDIGGLKSFVEDTEERIRVSMGAILQMNDVGDLLIRLVVMALIPAVVEEVFFRGLLQRFVTEWFGRAWVGIVLSALVFSLFHFRFTQLLPIFYVGILFGYIYYRTGNLTYTILLHFIHNGFIVVVSYFMEGAQEAEFMQDDHVPHLAWLLPSLLGLVAAVYFFRRIYPKSVGFSETEEQTEEGGADA